MNAAELKARQAPLKAAYQHDPASACLTLSAVGELAPGEQTVTIRNARGTLGVSKDAPVGFAAIRLTFALDTDASDEQLATLLRLSERYCVIYQSLKQPPQLAWTRLNR